MNRLMLRMKKSMKIKKNFFCIMAALVSCLVVVGGLILFMPKGYAAEGDSKENPIVIDPAVTSSYNLETGKYYKISSSASGTPYSAGVVLNIAKRTGQDVYLILDSVNFDLTTDMPAISFINKVEGSTKNTEPVKIHIVMSGNSTIRGISGAKSPLIQSENYSFAVDKFDANLVVGIGTGARTTYYSQNMELILEKYMDQIEGVGGLTLITGVDSYGAAIGSGEAQSMMSTIGVDTYVNVDTSSRVHPLGNDGNFANYWFYDKGTYLNGSENVKFGAAPVTIKGGSVSILGNGYGAGIGNGGTTVDRVNITQQQPVDVQGNILSLSARQNLGVVNIQNGTVSVVMSESSKGACFVNGAYTQVAADGLVTIDGGSVYIKRQGDDAIRREYTNAYNSSGEALALYIANVEADSNRKFTETGNRIEFSSGLINQYQAEENFQYYLSAIMYSSPSSGEPWSGGYVVEASQLSVALPSGGSYRYTGSRHTEGYCDSLGRAYLFLPAVKLNLYNLKIEDDNNQPVYGTYISNSKGVASSEVLSGYSYTEYTRNSNGIEIKESKYAIIKITNVPSYCESIEVTYRQTNEGGTSSGQVSPILGADGEYYVCLNVTEGNIVCSVKYNMGQYNINYNYGLLPEDVGANIVNNNPSTGECGQTVTLESPTWQGHIFAGWYLDEDLKNPATDLYTTRVGDSINVYAKWQNSITYVSSEGNLTGNKEYVVDYGKSFDIFLNEPNIQLSDNMAGMIEFIGWQAGDTLYTEDALDSLITIRENTTLTAKFKRSGYYVYITANTPQGAANMDIMNYVKFFRMIYANNLPQEFGQLDGNNYYRTMGFVDKTQPATVSLVMKDGYKVVSKSVKDENGNPINLISEDNSLNQFSFTMPEKDVYISIEFDVDGYNINYYDSVDGGLTQIDGSPNPSQYTVDSEDIIFTKPNTDKGRYWKFVGWRDFATNEMVSEIQTGTMAKDLMLVAVWEEVELYDIIMEESIYGTLKAYVDGVEVTKAAEGETVVLTATVGKGVKLKKMECKWLNEEGSTVTFQREYGEDVIDTSRSMTFNMPATSVNCGAEYDVRTYFITYLNLNDANNDNPNTYTVFDSFDLSQPEKEGWTFIGWKLITPDLSTEDENDVIETDITRIENMSGNLMLYAQWQEEEEEIGVYKATVDSGIVNGQVQLTKTEAAYREYVFVRVAEKTGYRLTALTYRYVEETPEYQRSSLIRFGFMRNNPSVDISINEIAAGVYYFVMPDSDVEITALFEPVEYTITYDVDGGEHNNPGNYTVEDNIILEPAEKEGYEFLGWYDELGAKIENIIEFTGDLVLKAQWELIRQDNPTEEPTEPPTENPTKDTTENPTTDNNGFQNEEETTTKTNSFVNSGTTQTGDSANVMRLIIVCIVCMVVMIVIVPKGNKEEEEL